MALDNSALRVAVSLFWILLLSSQTWEKAWADEQLKPDQLKPDKKENDVVEGVQLITIIPVCGEDEFLTSNGTHLICRTLPDVSFCDCPDLVPPGVPTTPTVVAPQPPPGCEVFLPPTRGAYTCLRNDDIIYCSVLCDHRFEFSSTPFNPYRCGAETDFNWMDFAGFIHTSLPDCTGFRHRLRTLHSFDYYLPAPCYGLSTNTIRVLLYDLQILLEENGCSKDDCPLENSFLQCPSVSSSVTFYNDIPNKRR